LGQKGIFDGHTGQLVLQDGEKLLGDLILRELQDIPLVAGIFRGGDKVVLPRLNEGEIAYRHGIFFVFEYKLNVPVYE
jgi:hypothetical protein